MLGVVHRAVLKQGPAQFFQYFRPTENRPSMFIRRHHTRKLVDLRQPHNLDIFNRSILGLPWVYNMLPRHIVELNSVRDFQSALQDLLILSATSGRPNWHSLFFSRFALHSHPLLNL